jgi:L-ribulose-5-phosphate 3-epimerase UlaE
LTIEVGIRNICQLIWDMFYAETFKENKKRFTDIKIAFVATKTHKAFILIIEIEIQKYRNQN